MKDASLFEAIAKKLPEIKEKYPGVHIEEKEQENSFEISGADHDQCIKVNQRLVYTMVDAIYFPSHSRYLLGVNSERQRLEFIPHGWQSYAGKKIWNSYRLEPTPSWSIKYYRYPWWAEPKSVKILTFVT